MKYRESELPDRLLYNKDSSWVKVENGVATIGIIEPIAKAVKEFLFVKLPEKGEIERGEVYVSLEALKWSGHLKSPVSGEVVEVNEKVYDEPSEINEKPYEAWIIKIELSDEDELKELFEAEKIVDWLDETLK